MLIKTIDLLYYALIHNSLKKKVILMEHFYLLFNMFCLKTDAAKLKIGFHLNKNDNEK